MYHLYDEESIKVVWLMKDKKNTSLRIKENITINFTGTTGPGLSWRYRIEVRLEKDQIEIWFSRDLDEYDLSIFPSRGKYGGMVYDNLFPHSLKLNNGNGLIELPISTINLLNKNYRMAHE